MEHLDFPSFLAERLRSRGMSLKKLAEVSGIAPNHLQNLADGHFGKLPAAPYLRGYLTAIGEILEFDPEEWWRQIKEEGFVVRSGATDELPKNRFAAKPIGKYIWAAILGVLLLGYLGFRFSQIIGRPVLVIDRPDATLAATTEGILTLAGRLENGDQLSINGEPVTTLADGTWLKRVSLQPGLNTFVISAKKLLGREVVVTRQIVYEPQGAAGASTSSEPAPTP